MEGYSQESIKKAEDRIRRQLDGNGVDPASITLNVKRQSVDVLKAQTTFDLDCSVEIQQAKGKRHDGKVIPKGNLQKEIDSFKEEIRQSEHSGDTARKQIKDLPFYGFGQEKNSVELSGQKQILTEHITCTRCQGSGKCQCPQCRGRTLIQCPQCYGRGKLKCDACLGNGKIIDGNTTKQCWKCHGIGEINCYNCQGKGEIPCTQCHMQGQITCPDCNGEGANSNIAKLVPFIKITSAIHIQDLEDDPKRMAGKIGGLALAKGGHIDVKVVKPPEQVEVEERAYFEAPPPDITKNTIFYEANLPWAVAEIVLNGQHHNITFVGKKGSVCESGKFMQQLVDPSFQKLGQALRGQENTVSAIKQACQLRVSRETFGMLGKSRPSKVMQNIYHAYPLGWSKPYIQNFVTAAYKSLKLATRMVRYAGLSIGLIACLGLYYLWFIMNIRPPLPAIPQPFDKTVDGLPVLGGIIVTILFIQIIGFVGYHRLMKEIGIKSKNTPPMGMAGVYAVLGNLMIGAAFITAQYLGLY